MSSYDELPFSAAHIKALEAGLKLFKPDDAELPDLRDVFAGDRSGCQGLYNEAQEAYAAAAEAAFSGSHQQWVDACAAATDKEKAYNNCLHQSFPHKDVYKKA